MSATWQDYVNTQLVGTSHVDQALMCGKQDGAVWANTPDFLPRLYEAAVTQDDGSEANQTINEAVILTKIGQTLRKPPEGLRVNGVKYMITRTYPNGSADDGLASIYFSKGQGGGALVVTNQAVIVATYDKGKGQTASQCNFTVESLGRYLFESGY
jgi:hypothetical protein